MFIDEPCSIPWLHSLFSTKTHFGQIIALFLIVYFVLLCLVFYIPILYHQNLQKDSRITLCRQLYQQAVSHPGTHSTPQQHPFWGLTSFCSNLNDCYIAFIFHHNPIGSPESWLSLSAFLFYFLILVDHIPHLHAEKRVNESFRDLAYLKYLYSAVMLGV